MMIAVGGRLAAVLVLVLAAGSCAGDDAFVCNNDAQCVAGDGMGRCEADQRCSYPDDDCASGRRYGRWSGARSGQCVDDSSIAGTSSGSSSGPSTTTTVTTSTTTNDASTSGAGSTSSTGGSTGGSSSGESTGNIPLVPLGHWPLDEGDGVIIYDSGSAAHDGVLEDGMWVAGPGRSPALRFPAEDAGVDVGAYTEYDLVGASGLTLMGWARFDDFVIANVSIIAKFGSFGLQFWGNDELSGAHPVVYLYPEGSSADGDTDGPIDQYGGVFCSGVDLLLDGPTDAENLSVWHHYAATYDLDSRMLRLFVDGAEICGRDVSSEMLDGTIEVGTTRLQLGRWQTSGPTLLGAIDDVRIYDVAIAPEDIVAIVNAP